MGLVSRLSFAEPTLSGEDADSRFIHILKYGVSAPWRMPYFFFGFCLLTPLCAWGPSLLAFRCSHRGAVT